MKNNFIEVRLINDPAGKRALEDDEPKRSYSISPLDLGGADSGLTGQGPINPNPTNPDDPNNPPNNEGDDGNDDNNAGDDTGGDNGNDNTGDNNSGIGETGNEEQTTPSAPTIIEPTTFAYINKNEILYLQQHNNNDNTIIITLKNGERICCEGIIYDLLNILNED